MYPFHQRSRGRSLSTGVGFLSLFQSWSPPLPRWQPQNSLQAASLDNLRSTCLLNAHFFPYTADSAYGRVYLFKPKKGDLDLGTSAKMVAAGPGRHHRFTKMAAGSFRHVLPQSAPKCQSRGGRPQSRSAAAGGQSGCGRTAPEAEPRWSRGSPRLSSEAAKRCHLWGRKSYLPQPQAAQHHLSRSQTPTMCGTR